MVHSEDRSGFLSLISLLPEPQSPNREMVSGSTFSKGGYILGITKDFLSPFSSHPAALSREHGIAVQSKGSQRDPWSSGISCPWKILLEMQVLQPCPDLLNPPLGWGPAICIFTSPPGHADPH